MSSAVNMSSQNLFKNPRNPIDPLIGNRLMKGIILAGGKGSRLFPLTHSISKQLLPIYNKPMIYYPLSVLLQANIRDILIISSPESLPYFQKLLGDGNLLGITLSYAEQKNPGGIAEAFVIGAPFIGSDSVTLILGDNFFHGSQLKVLLDECQSFRSGGMVFGYKAKNLENYGVLAFDDQNKVRDIIEKPKNPPSPYAVIGLYCFDNRVVEIAKGLKPSKRGELEIVDIQRAYLALKDLHVRLHNTDFVWIDSGTFDSLYAASSYVKSIEEKEGVMVGCIEEIAFKKGWIGLNSLGKLTQTYLSSEYGQYLLALLERNFVSL